MNINVLLMRMCLTLTGPLTVLLNENKRWNNIVSLFTPHQYFFRLLFNRSEFRQTYNVCIRAYFGVLLFITYPTHTIFATKSCPINIRLDKNFRVKG